MSVGHYLRTWYQPEQLQQEVSWARKEAPLTTFVFFCVFSDDSKHHWVLCSQTDKILIHKEKISPIPASCTTAHKETAAEEIWGGGRAGELVLLPLQVWDGSKGSVVHWTMELQSTPVLVTAWQTSPGLYENEINKQRGWAYFETGVYTFPSYQYSWLSPASPAGVALFPPVPKSHHCEGWQDSH